MNERKPYFESRWTAGSDKHPRPGPITGIINGRSTTTFGYTEAQYRSLNVLLDHLLREFPNVAKTVVCDAAGAVVVDADPSWTTRSGIMPATAIEQCSGPGPAFDWSRLGALSCKRPKAE